MPHCSRNVKLEDGNSNIDFSYECWKHEGTGEGIISVKGNTDNDHLFLMNNRKDIVEAIQEAESLSKIRYFENQGNGTHSEMNIERDENGDVSQVLNHNTSLSSKELSEQGRKLLDEEHDYHMNLSAHSFSNNPEINRIKTNHAPEH